MIKLKNILKEFDFGDKIQSQNLLLANPAVYGRYSSKEEGGGSGGILTAALKEKGYIVDRHI